MEIAAILFVIALCGTHAAEKKEEPSLIHHLTKRQTSEGLRPIPSTADDQYAPLPYQQGQVGGSSAAASESSGSDARANRDYQPDYSSHGQNGSTEDWMVSASLGQGSSSSSQAGSDSSSNPQAGSDSSSSGRRPYYQYQAPISSGRRVPTQAHVAGNTRYTYSQPVSSGRRGPGRTYSYPFGGSRTAGSYAQSGNGPSAGGGDSNGVGSQSASVSGDEEPVVQVFPSERPVINPQASRQQQIRQRELERQRRLQLLRRQARQQARQTGQPSRQTGQSRPQRPIYTGSRPLGNSYGQPYYLRGQQQPVRGRVQPVYSSQGQPIYSSQGQPVYTSQGQPLYGQSQPTYAGQGQPVYGGQGQPVYGGQGQPVYGGIQQPYPNYGYSQGGFDSSEYDSECPNTGIRIQINGIPCEQAIDRYGSYLCYRHEYTSRECCMKCRTLKNPARVGCEYGDHSGRCQQLQSYDCYDLRNRQSCCQSCDRMRKRGLQSGSLQQNGMRTSCEYGDMTPNCDRVRQNPGLCYIPENRYLCCETCHNIRVTDNAECPWGDQNPDLCEPFDGDGNIRINCYAPPIKRICCQACQRLEDWIPMDQPGCEYGDRPVTFNTGTHRNLNCTAFMRFYGYEQCSVNQAVSTNCCYTCHRYTQG